MLEFARLCKEFKDLRDLRRYGMNESTILDIAREAILTVIMLGGPLVLIALAVGLMVSIFQTITSIQEQTLSFVPKILAVFLGLYLLFGYSVRSLVKFFQTMMEMVGPLIKG